MAADPIKLQLDLLETPDFEIDVRKSQMSGSEPMIAKESDAAFRRIVAATRKVFGIDPLDPDTEDGLTDPEVYAEVAKFADYMAELKKKLGFSQTASSSTEPAISEAERLLMQSVSDSGSTATEPSTDKPEPPCSESPPPSAGSPPS